MPIQRTGFCSAFWLVPLSETHKTTITPLFSWRSIFLAVPLRPLCCIYTLHPLPTTSYHSLLYYPYYKSGTMEQWNSGNEINGLTLFQSRSISRHDRKGGTGLQWNHSPKPLYTRPGECLILNPNGTRAKKGGGGGWPVAFEARSSAVGPPWLDSSRTQHGRRSTTRNAGRVGYGERWRTAGATAGSAPAL